MNMQHFMYFWCDLQWGCNIFYVYYHLQWICNFFYVFAASYNEYAMYVAYPLQITAKLNKYNENAWRNQKKNTYKLIKRWAVPKKPKLQGFEQRQAWKPGPWSGPPAASPPRPFRIYSKPWNVVFVVQLNVYLLCVPSSIFNTFLDFNYYLQWICKMLCVFVAIYNEYAICFIFLLLFTIHMQHSLCFCCLLQWIRKVCYIFIANNNKNQ